MNIKSLLKSLLILFFLTFSCSHGQNKTNVLKSIKSKYVTIEALLQNEELKEKQKEYTCKGLSIEGSVAFYYENQNLKLIIHSFDQGHYSTCDSYYLHNDNLFFYYREESIDNDTPIRDEKNGELLDTYEDWGISEFRVYFDEEKAIKCLVKAYENEDVTDKIKEEYSEFSDYFKNKKVVCDSSKITEVLLSFNKLIKLQSLNKENICFLHQ
ncbi:hypothetical protein [Aquimarina sp. MMG016]|uniref:hypothetical protein n=1 Tax=Aquimarina sp. MMG016 TaxID=2822690 RepID=UPI001B39EFF1|nr:hypothetical protein [Aquimarina sp. MMG016]MBQ4819792.1 hypothetical protein [Aquimarina sp. MMG016]